MADDERNKDWEDAAKVANEIIDERGEKEIRANIYERIRNESIQSEQAKTIRRHVEQQKEHVEQQKELSEIIEKNREALKKNIKEIARWSAEYDRVCKQRDDVIGELMRVRNLVQQIIFDEGGGQSPSDQEK